MREKIKTLILLLSCVLSISATNFSAQDLVITEIMYNPAESGTDTTEFIEIYNNSAVAVNMTGFTLTGGIYTFPNVTIPAYGYYVVAINASAFNNIYGFPANGVFTNGLSNVGESIVLKDAAGVVLDSVRYFNATPWPAATANGGGASIVLCDANSDNNIGSNWATETIPVGVVLNGLPVLASPGMANGCSAASLDVEASEFLNLSSTYCHASAITASFVISNVLATTANNIRYTVAANGFVIAFDSIATLPGMASDTITLGPIPAMTGIANVVVYTSLMGDADLSNDTISMMVAISNTTASANVTDSILCNGGSNGEVTAIGSNGLASLYNYQWDAATGNQTTAIATGLAAGTYAVTVTDSIGCAAAATIVLSEPTVINSTQDLITNISCFGANDGAIMMTFSGGTPGYTFIWSNGATTEDITGLSAGSYNGMVTDANGCTDNTAFVITSPSLLSATAMDNADGTATASGSGGTSPYTYLWDASASNQTTATATGLTSNSTYMVTITDDNGCTDTASVMVVFVGVEEVANLSKLDIFPNPTNGNVFVTLDLIENAAVEIILMNAIGQTLMTKVLQNVQSEQITLQTADLPAGFYTIQLLIGSEQLTRKLVISKH